MSRHLNTVYRVAILVTASFLIYLLSSCAYSCRIENGDLLFQTAVNQGMEQAIEASTSRDKDMNYVHVGIAISTSNGICVIEAVPPKVRVVQLRKFLGEGKNKPVTEVYRILCSDSIKSNAINKALSLVGSPYDNLFRAGNNAYYCSELVLECFVDSDQKALFGTQSMSFKNSDGVFPEFWITYFNNLNAPIPEGERGSNPNDLSRCKLLQYIDRLP